MKKNVHNIEELLFYYKAQDYEFNNLNDFETDLLTIKTSQPPVLLSREYEIKKYFFYLEKEDPFTIPNINSKMKWRKMTHDDLSSNIIKKEPKVAVERLKSLDLNKSNCLKELLSKVKKALSLENSDEVMSKYDEIFNEFLSFKRITWDSKVWFIKLNFNDLVLGVFSSKEILLMLNHNVIDDETSLIFAEKGYIDTKNIPFTLKIKNLSNYHMKNVNNINYDNLSYIYQMN